MAKNKNTIFWIIGILIISFLIFGTPLKNTFSGNVFNVDLCTSTGGIIKPYTFERQPIGDVIVCGGIQGILCPSGQSCKLSRSYPDAQGKCIEIVEATRCLCPDNKPFFGSDGCSANELITCLTFCTPMYELKEKDVVCVRAPCPPMKICEYNACGSSCGPNNNTTFKTLNECKVAAGTLIDDNDDGFNLKDIPLWLWVTIGGIILLFIIIRGRK